ncbi:MAG: hypothetical protein NT038_01935 [Euryarchaeota archaeon]|nr:hypothetical protein [Euryarchaeota archaeon]
MKQKIISLKGISITRLLSIILLIIGLVLLVRFLLFQLFSIFLIQSQMILAFSILFFGGAGILYFFHTQFAKLAQIAKEVENGNYDSSDCEDSVEETQSLEKIID